MAKRRRPWLVIIVLAAAVLYLLLEEYPKSKRRSHRTPPTFQGTDLFHGVPPEGTGGDPALNRKKNRTAPASKAHPYSVGEIIALPHDALDRAGSKDREHWQPEAIDQAEHTEATPVLTEGYLLRYKRSGVESCNGYIDSLRDVHLWLSQAPMAPLEQSIIAEITPREAEMHPAWTPKAIAEIIKQKQKVRLGGWILWDQEHASEVGKSRASLWEIHPITSLEIFENGHWIKLDDTELP